MESLCCTLKTNVMWYVNYTSPQKIVLVKETEKERKKSLEVFNSPYYDSMPEMFMFILVAQLCPTLCNPMDCNLSGPSVHGILQARILEWDPIALLQGICIAGDSLPLSHWGSPGMCFLTLPKSSLHGHEGS